MLSKVGLTGFPIALRLVHRSIAAMELRIARRMHKRYSATCYGGLVSGSRSEEGFDIGYLVALLACLV